MLLAGHADLWGRLRASRWFSRLRAALFSTVILAAGCTSSAHSTTRYPTITIMVAPATTMTTLSPSAIHRVIVTNTAFNPASIQIKGGEIVEWVFEDGNTQHNVTGPAFTSPTESSGGVLGDVLLTGYLHLSRQPSSPDDRQGRGGQMGFRQGWRVGSDSFLGSSATLLADEVPCSNAAGHMFGAPTLTGEP